MIPRIDKGTVEYTLRIGKSFHKETSKQCYRFLFETIEEFNYFHYLITIEHKQSDGEIHFKILGLRPKGITLPGNDKAKYSIDFFDMKGEYKIKVFKPGDTMNEFQIKISSKGVQVLRDIKQKKPFLSVSVL